MGLRNRLGFIDWQKDAAFQTNGNGHAVAVGSPALVEAKAYPGSGVQFVGPNTARLYSILGNTSSEAEEVNRLTAFAAAAYCYVAMRYRAEKYSEPPLMVVDEGDDGEEWLPDHALADFLDAPSPDFDMGELLYLTRIYRDNSGACVWAGDRDRAGRIARLTPFSADDIDHIDAVNGRIFGRFHLRTAEGRVRPYAPEDIVFFREPNPNDWHGFTAPVDVALAALNLSQQVRATTKSVLRNAVFPSIVIQTHPEWNPTDLEWERFKAELDAHAVTEDKGKPLALTGGGTATRVTFSLKDLVPDEIMDRVEATVAAVFGIPAVVLQYLVGLKNSPWSQMEEARRMNYEDTFVPMWRRDEKVLTRQLLRAADPAPNHYIRFDLSRIQALKADDTKRAAVVAQLADVWTVDEGRIYTGQEPLPEGDPRAQLIISHARPQKIAAPSEPNGRGGQPGDEKRAPQSRLSTKGAAESPDRREAWLRFDVQTKAQEESWYAAASDQLERDRAAILALCDDAGVKADDPRPLIERLLFRIDGYLQAAEKTWRAAINPVLTATARTATRTLASELGLRFDVLTPGLTAYTKEHAGILVRQITDTTRTALADTLATGIKNGESIEKLRARVEQSDAAFGRARAELIARTETTTVTNAVQRESLADYAKRNGLRAVKTWLATQDERTRDEHAAMDGEEREIDDSFSNGLMAPGEPNCRCTLTYSLPETD